MSALIPTPRLEADPVNAERVAHEQFAREHSDPDYRELLADLYRAWHGYNVAYFGGRLNVPHIALGRTSPRRFSMCRRTTNYGGAMCLTLNDGVAFGRNRRVVRGPGGAGWLRFLADLLLAETVAQAVRELGHDDEEGYDGYGPRFVAHANRIGSELGLGEVVARRRAASDGGLVPATRWPWAVRPAGYYLGDVVLPAAVRRWPGPVPAVVYQAGVYQYFLYLLGTAGGADRLRQILGRQVDAARLAAFPSLAAAERGPKVRPQFDTAWLDWNGGCVALIGQHITRTRSFDVMPILADALEDAGCDDAQILGHCRQPESHTADCWVLKAIRPGNAQ